MKAKEIQDLIDFISNSGLEEVNIETSEFKIRVKRSAKPVSVEMAPAPQAAIPVAPNPVDAEVPAAVSAPKPGESEENGNYLTIKSPMIGTFYRSPDPDSEVFVNVGDKISKGNPVCIIEAMKLFNEIESEISGTIVKVLVDNAQPVEYDQPLFLIDPS